MHCKMYLPQGQQGHTSSHPQLLLAEMWTELIAVGGAQSRRQSNATRITRHPVTDPVNAVIAIQAHTEICKIHLTAQHPLNHKSSQVNDVPRT